MKTLACKDLGMRCKFVAKGRLVGAIKKKMMAHGKKAHADKMEKMTKAQMAAFNKKMSKMVKSEEKKAPKKKTAKKKTTKKKR